MQDYSQLERFGVHYCHPTPPRGRPSGQRSHYLELNIHLITPIEELIGRVDEFPTIY